MLRALISTFPSTPPPPGTVVYSAFTSLTEAENHRLTVWDVAHFAPQQFHILTCNSCTFVEAWLRKAEELSSGGYRHPPTNYAARSSFLGTLPQPHASDEELPLPSARLSAPPLLGPASPESGHTDQGALPAEPQPPVHKANPPPNTGEAQGGPVSSSSQRRNVTLEVENATIGRDDAQGGRFVGSGIGAPALVEPETKGAHHAQSAMQEHQQLLTNGDKSLGPGAGVPGDGDVEMLAPAAELVDGGDAENSFGPKAGGADHETDDVDMMLGEELIGGGEVGATAAAYNQDGEGAGESKANAIVDVGGGLAGPEDYAVPVVQLGGSSDYVDVTVQYCSTAGQEIVIEDCAVHVTTDLWSFLPSMSWFWSPDSGAPAPAGSYSFSGSSWVGPPDELDSLASFSIPKKLRDWCDQGKHDLARIWMVPSRGVMKLRFARGSEELKQLLVMAQQRKERDGGSNIPEVDGRKEEAGSALDGSSGPADQQVRYSDMLTVAGGAPCIRFARR